MSALGERFQLDPCMGRSQDSRRGGAAEAALKLEEKSEVGSWGLEHQWKERVIGRRIKWILLTQGQPTAFQVPMD